MTSDQILAKSMLTHSDPIILELKGKPVHWNCSERVELAHHGVCLPERIIVTFGRGETWTKVEARHYDYGVQIGYREKEIYIDETGYAGLPRRTLIDYAGDVHMYNADDNDWDKV